MTSDTEEDGQNSRSDSFNQAMESALRITLAGFGGVLVGLSLSQRRGTVGVAHNTTVLVKPMIQRASQRSRSITNRDLPTQWAVSCLTFATIFECSRLMSPISHFTDSRYLQTIGDYAVGGLVAGSILRGLPVRGNSGPGAVATPRFGAGLFSGLILGIIPGVIVTGISLLEEFVESLDVADREDSTEIEAKEAVTPSATTNTKNA
jgi:hypothetical protein